MECRGDPEGSSVGTSDCVCRRPFRVILFPGLRWRVAYGAGCGLGIGVVSLGDLPCLRCRTRAHSALLRCYRLFALTLAWVLIVSPMLVPARPLSAAAPAPKTSYPAAVAESQPAEAPPSAPGDAPLCALYPIALHTQTLAGVAEGTVVNDIFNGSQPGNFGWLSWTGHPSVPTLVESLTPPGDSETYTNPDAPNDHVVSIGDWVPGKPGVSNSKQVRDALDLLKTLDITVPVWDSTTNNGSNSRYHVAAFARIRLVSYHLPSQNRISARFLGYTTCDGTPPTPTPTPTPLPTETPTPTWTPESTPEPTITATPTSTPTATPTPIPQLPQLTLAVTAPATTSPGTPIPYLLEITNVGNAAATSATATITFPDGSTGSMLITNLAPGATINGSLQWTVPVIPTRAADETESAYNDRLAAADGAVLTSSVTLVWQDAQGAPLGQVSQAASTTEQVPILTLAAAAPATVRPGELVTIDLTIQNVGSGASGPLRVRVANPDGITTGATAPALPAGETAVLHTSWAVPTFAKGSSESDAEYQARLADNMQPQDFAAELDWEDVASNPYGTIAAQASSALAAPLPILALELDGPEQVRAGEATTYTVTLHNIGQSDAVSMSLALIMPDNTIRTLDLGGALAPSEQRQFSVPFVVGGVEAGSPYRAHAQATWQDSMHNAFGPISATQTSTLVYDAPVAVDDNYTVDIEQTLTVTNTGVLVNDHASNGQSLTAVLTSPPAHGTLALTPNGAFRYAPTSAVTGTDQFTYVVDDGLSRSVPATVVISITGVLNRPPIVDAGSDQTVTLPTNSVTLSGQAADDGRPLGKDLLVYWSKVEGPGGVSFGTPNAAVTTATFSLGGTYRLRLTADDSALIVSDTVTIHVVQPATVIAKQDANYLYRIYPLGGVPGDFGALTFDDSTFVAGEAAFGSGGGCAIQATRRTFWPTNSEIVLRKRFDLPAGARNLRITAAIDNDIQIFFNGVDISGGLISHENCANVNEFVFPIADQLVQVGQNLLAVRGRDRGSEGFLDVAVIAEIPTSSVTPGNTPPLVDAGADQTIVAPVHTVQLQGTATDDGIPASGTLATTWRAISAPGPISIANTHQLTTSVTVSTPGRYVLELRADDGEFSTSAYMVITQQPAPEFPPSSGPGLPPTPSGPLTVPGWIGGPANQSTISQPTPITLANGVTLQQGTIDYWPADNPNAATPLATNVSGSGGATLATFDPTLLANGSYVIRLSGTDSGGNQVNSGILVTVVGDYKPGRVSFSVTDLTIPVTGLPITIGRTYDSLERNRSGDFGYGWSLSVGHPQLTIDQAHNVTLTQPNGQRATFFFSPVSYGGFFGFLLKPNYMPERGVYGSLSTDGCPLMVSSGGSLFCFLDTAQYQPTVYTYTDPYGRVYRMGADGGMLSIGDLNGNTLMFGPGGIASSSGDIVVPFARDSQGRITQITDPAGNIYRYGYDGSGDLKTVTFPSLDAASPSPVAEYFYSASHPHLYERSTDPLGRNIAVNAYYTSPADPPELNGRLKSVTERLDENTTFTTSYAYDLTANTMTTTNPDGGRVVYEYAATGSGAPLMVRETIDIRRDAQGQVETSTTRYRYDASQSLAAIALPDPDTGEAAPFASDPATCAPRNICYTYDSTGNRTGVTDALGHIARVEYNQWNRPARLIDAEGRIREVHYDSYGNIDFAEDSLGVMGGYTYDSYGNPTSSYLGADSSTATTYTYDQYGHVASTTDPLGNATLFADYSIFGGPGTITLSIDDGFGQTLIYHYNKDYNTLGGVTAMTISDGDGLDATNAYTYDRVGNVTEVRDTATGWSTTYDYYYNGAVKQASTTGAAPVSYTYTWRGDIETMTAEDGKVIRYEYDYAGNLVNVTEAWEPGKPPTQSYSYDLSGRQFGEADAEGHTALTRYDAGDRPVALEDPVNGAAHRTQLQYDDANRLTIATAVDGSQLHYTYDARGFPIEITNSYGTPDAQTWSQEHDGTGKITERTDLNGKTMVYGYDAASQLISVTNPMSETTSYIRDGAGNVRRITDANGRTTTYEYDALGQVTRTIWPDQSEETFTHTFVQPLDNNPAHDQAPAASAAPDDVLLRVEHELTDNHVNYSYYDSQGQLLRANYFDGEVVEYAYALAGQVSQVKDGRGTTCYVYDELQRVTSIDQLGDGAGLTCGISPVERRVSSTYDDNGNRRSVSTIVGMTTKTVGYAYDALNRLCVVEVGGIPASCADTAGNFAYTYEDFVADPDISRRDTVTYPNGLIETAAYDSLGRLNILQQQLNSTTLASYAYTFDPAGNRRGVTELDGSTTAWEYSDANRLMRELHKDGADAPLWDLNFTYDSAGNRLTMQDAVSGSTMAYTYRPNGLDQVESVTIDGTTTRPYAYDGRGNLLSDGVATYAYDARDQLAGVSGPGYSRSYEYDVLGNMFRQTADGVVTEYLWDELSPYGDVLAEIDGSGSVKASYVMGGITLLEQTSGGTTSYPLRDAQGSTRALFDTGSGVVAERYLYDAFGALRGSSATSTDYLYTGQRFNSATGLYYLRARFYNPADGRLLSRDTYPVNFENPDQLHRYVYGANNPVNGFDPTGQMLIEYVATDKMNEEQRRAHARYHAGIGPSMGMDRLALQVESILSTIFDGFFVAGAWITFSVLERRAGIAPGSRGSIGRHATMGLGTVYHLGGSTKRPRHTVTKAVTINAAPSSGTCQWSSGGAEYPLSAAAECGSLLAELHRRPAQRDHPASVARLQRGRAEQCSRRQQLVCFGRGAEGWARRDIDCALGVERVWRAADAPPHARHRRVAQGMYGHEI